MHTIVLGLGNPILRDDAVGLLVARGVREALNGRPGVAVEEASTSGFDLLDILSGFEKAVIIDAMRTPGGVPGGIREFKATDLTASRRLAAMHEINLPTALALGRAMGISMPQEVVVIGIEVEDDETFDEECTPQVRDAVEPAVRRVLDAIGEV